MSDKAAPLTEGLSILKSFQETLDNEFQRFWMNYETWTERLTSSINPPTQEIVELYFGIKQYKRESLFPKRIQHKMKELGFTFNQEYEAWAFKL